MKNHTVLLCVILAASGVAAAQAPSRPDPLASLVSSERAFAAAGLAEGIRASFMKFFSDSAIAFSPAPFVYKEVVAKRPPPADPHARTLRWEPHTGDISASGDLGYLMGPSILTDNTAQHAPASYGFYLSVWRRQDDGAWKVELDVGTEATAAIQRYFGKPFRALGRAGSLPQVHSGQFVSDRFVLHRLDSTLSERQTAGGVGRAYGEVLAPGARALRDGIGPIIGRTAILAYIGKVKGARFLTPAGGGISQSGDLGYTYGAFRGSSGASAPSGYYVHLWKKVQGETWRLVVDKESPADNP
jgi:ketosteroid isomerase-like protein